MKITLLKSETSANLRDLFIYIYFLESETNNLVDKSYHSWFTVTITIKSLKTFCSPYISSTIIIVSFHCEKLSTVTVPKSYKENQGNRMKREIGFLCTLNPCYNNCLKEWTKMLLKFEPHLKENLINICKNGTRNNHSYTAQQY